MGEPSSPNTPHGSPRTPLGVGLRSVTPIANVVRNRLSDDPLWGYFALNGKWICPFCLSPVSRRPGRTREDSIAVHLEGCRSYGHGTGTSHPSETIARRQQFENLVHLADSDLAWRVYDSSGTWVCPACLERVAAVRAIGGQLNSFVYQAMAEHLGRCGAYLRGLCAPAEEVTAARDRIARVPLLVQALRQQLPFPVWRYVDPLGLWVCPYCLAHTPEIAIRAEGDIERAVEAMALHLLGQCPAYRSNPNQMQSETLIRQAAMLRVATPNRLPIGTQTDLPVGRPATGQTLTPRAITPPLAMPVERRTPSGGVRIVPVRSVTPPSAIPVVGYRASEPVTIPPPIAAPVAPPVPHTPAPARTQHDGLFGNLPEDFLSTTPLGNLELDAPPPEVKARPVASPRTPLPGDHSGLNWMDAMEPGEREPEPGVGERTDLIRAKDLQIEMMQKAPDIPGFRFAATFEACADISGDFFQFIRLPDGKLGFALGDVSGHGVQAGMIMSMAKKTLEIYASTGLSPADTLSKVNDALARDLGGKLFISMVYALLDPIAHTITWARAGHNPTLRYRGPGHEIEEIKPPGMVVGMKSGPMFRKSLQEQVTELEPGDCFVLYTDGITETMNLQQEEFGQDRLCEVVKRFADAGPEAMIERIREIVRHFRGPQPPNDDATVLILMVD